LSAFGDFSAPFLNYNLLKMNDLALANDLQFPFLVLQEIVVIIFALLVALALLVAVTFISSLDLSNTRRH